MIVFPTGRVVGPAVCGHLDPSSLEQRGRLRHLLIHPLRLLLAHLLVRDRNNNHLDLRNARRQHQPLVIRMHHDHHPDRPGRHAPRVLVRVQPPAVSSLVLRLILYSKHLRKVLPQVMAGRPLHAPPRRRNERLDRRRIVRPRKLLLRTLHPRTHRHRQQLLIHAPIQIQNLPHLRISLRLARKRRVPLLPQKLPAPNERRRVAELPSNHVRPLIQSQRKVAVRADPVGIVRVHDRLGRRTNRNRPIQLRLPVLRHPRHLRRESLHMILLRHQRILRDEQGKVRILHAHRLDLPVKPLLDLVPDRVRPRTKDVAARYVVVRDHLRLDADLRVPLPKVRLLLGVQPQLGHALGIALLFSTT
mmetsp:Transcript_4352/g.12346  ORF Transcript_4352/g.12346 Transcript_4352/m.12346 type:complete len:360 (-) Transcript_4352:220-1299(-)